MRTVTNPLFPAQVAGAVTLQDLIDAREGDRLPLDLALYVSAQLGKQVEQLKVIGRQGVLDPKRVWCTSKGAVVVHEAVDTSRVEPRGLARLIYRLLSGAGDVSAWPPSYFNPSVAEPLDAAVMSAVNEEQPEDLQAVVEAVNAASVELDPEASVAGMARLVFAVPDPEPAPPPAPGPLAPVVTAPRRKWPLAAAAGVLLVGAFWLGFSTSSPAPVAAPVPVAAKVVAAPKPGPWRLVVPEKPRPRVTAIRGR